MEKSLLQRFPKELNMDPKKYRTNPTEHDTIKIFTFFINKIRLAEPDTPRTIVEIYRDVNYFLAKLQSSVRVSYAEFLEPNQTTLMAAGILNMHVSMKIAFSSGENRILHVIDHIKDKTNQMQEAETELQQHKIELSSGNELQALKHAEKEEDATILQQDRYLATEKERLKKKMTTLKHIQDQNDLLEVQIDAIKSRCDTLDKLIEQENDQYRVISTFDSKTWQLQSLNEENKKLEATARVPLSVAYPVDIIATLSKLSDDIVQTLDAFAGNDALADVCFVTQKKLTNMQKQIYELEQQKEDYQNDNIDIQELNSFMTEFNTNKANGQKLRKKVFKLYNKIIAVNEKTRKLENFHADNIAILHIFNEQCSDSWENNRNHFG